jgi:hypothetical protein
MAAQLLVENSSTVESADDSGKKQAVEAKTV